MSNALDAARLIVAADDAYAGAWVDTADRDHRDKIWLRYTEEAIIGGAMVAHALIESTDQRDRLAAFARAVIGAGCWGAFSGLDGGGIQDFAAEHGLIVETAYDPAVHGEQEYDIDPGEPWYVFADWLAEDKA